MRHLRRHHLERPRHMLKVAIGALTFALGIAVDELLFNEHIAAIALGALALTVAILCFHQRRVYLAMISTRVMMMEPKDTANALHSTL